MLLHLQFPIADLRHIAELQARLAAPSWPSPVANEEFVRSFGGVRRRRGGGISGWVAESEFCDASKAVGGINQKALGHSNPGLNLRTVFRRLYADGLALAKVEIGLACEQPPASGGLEAFLKDILALPVRVKEPNGGSKVQLAESAKSIAALYEYSTSRCEGKPDFLPSGLVRAEPPMLFIEVSKDDCLDVGRLPGAGPA